MKCTIWVAYRKTIRLSKAVNCFKQVIEYEEMSDVGLLAKKELDVLECKMCDTMKTSLKMVELLAAKMSTL